MDDSIRVSILSEALPTYKVLEEENRYKIWWFYYGKRKLKGLFRDIALLSSVGVCPVVIHGGGPKLMLAQ